MLRKVAGGYWEHPGRVVDLPAPQNGFLHCDSHSRVPPPCTPLTVPRTTCNSGASAAIGNPRPKALTHREQGQVCKTGLNKRPYESKRKKEATLMAKQVLRGNRS